MVNKKHLLTLPIKRLSDSPGFALGANCSAGTRAGELADPRSRRKRRRLVPLSVEFHAQQNRRADRVSRGYPRTMLTLNGAVPLPINASERRNTRNVYFRVIVTRICDLDRRIGIGKFVNRSALSRERHISIRVHGCCSSADARTRMQRIDPCTR